MRDEKGFQMAMFKYEVIVPLLHKSGENLQSRMQNSPKNSGHFQMVGSKSMPGER